MDFLKLFLFNSFFCGITSLGFIILRRLFRNKISHTTLYYTGFFSIVLFIIPLYKFVPDKVISSVHSISTNYLNTTQNITNIFEMEHVNSITNKNNMLYFLTALWIIIFILILGYMFFNYFDMIRKLSRWKRRFYYENKFFDPQKIYKCSIITTPLLIGVFKSSLLLPENIDSNDLKLILNHEAIHQRRKDVLIKLIVSIITAFNWFNPAVWLLRHIINIECELSCDETVIKKIDKKAKVDYINIIVNYAEIQNNISCSFGISFQNDTRFLKERINLVMYDNTNNKLYILFVYIIFAIVLCSNTSIATFLRAENILPQKVIINYVNNPELFSELASKTYFEPDFIESIELIDIEKGDNQKLTGYHANYDGSYSDLDIYNVTYNITYKDEVAHKMTEQGGTKQKIFILLKSENGWIIDSIGY